MFLSSVHTGFGPLRSAVSWRAPLGSGRAPLSRFKVGTGLLASAAETGAAAPSCPLPRRSRPVVGHPIPTWEELLGER